MTCVREHAVLRLQVTEYDVLAVQVFQGQDHFTDVKSRLILSKCSNLPLRKNII